MKTERELLAEINYLRKRNSELHRRLQQKESPWQSEVNTLRLKCEWNEMYERQTYRRLLGAHNELKEIFKMIAPFYGISCEKFHTVSDNNFHDRTAEGIWANVYLNKQGEIESYRVLNLVKKLVDEKKETENDV